MVLLLWKQWPENANSLSHPAQLFPSESNTEPSGFYFVFTNELTLPCSRLLDNRRQPEAHPTFVGGGSFQTRFKTNYQAYVSEDITESLAWVWCEAFREGDTQQNRRKPPEKTQRRSSSWGQPEEEKVVFWQNLQMPLNQKTETKKQSMLRSWLRHMVITWDQSNYECWLFPFLHFC